MITVPSLSDMLAAGVHFGHKTSRWHPAMAKFIFTAKSGVHVINLEETQKNLVEAGNFLAKLASEGKTVLFVGTKKQAQAIVAEAAVTAKMPYVNFRWLGGTLTNFSVVRSSIERYIQEKNILENKTEGMSKRDITILRDRVAKGDRIYGGLVDMVRRPDAIVLIGAHDEKSALAEAHSVHIPVVAVVDTNADPNGIDYPVPANDDATKSIRLITAYLANAVSQGKKAVKKEAEAPAK